MTMHKEEEGAYALLGLAAKAGKVVSGEFSTEKAVREGKAKLIVLAADASDNTKKKFTDKGAYYHTPVVAFGTKERLGASIGKELRSSAAVTDRGLADAVMQKLTRNTEGIANGKNQSA